MRARPRWSVRRPAGGGLTGTATAGADDAWVAQVGTYDYPIAPDHDGLAPVGTIVRGQTLGLGTFDRLDGELVLVGGVTYRVGIDGVPRRADPASSTPFLQAIRFAPQASGPVPPGTTCAQLSGLVDALAQTQSGAVAVTRMADAARRGRLADSLNASIDPRRPQPRRAPGRLLHRHSPG